VRVSAVTFLNDDAWNLTPGPFHEKAVSCQGKLAGWWAKRLVMSAPASIRTVS